LIHQHIQKIISYGEMAAEIIAEIGSYSRTVQTVPVPDPVDINEVLDASVQLVRHAGLLEGLHIVRDFSPELPLVWGSFHEFQQVFINLLHNAGDVLRESGGEIRLATRADHGFVEATVQDTGPGIVKEHLDRLFEPFFTTKPAGQGTGLGLAVVHRIVTRYNGTIGVDSRSGEGAAFRVRIPVGGNK
jgi:signal transduction histidine kinase